MSKNIINVIISDELYGELKRLKEKTGHSFSTIIRLALIEYLRKLIK